MAAHTGGRVSLRQSRAQWHKPVTAQFRRFSISQWPRNALRAIRGLRSLIAPPETHKSSCPSHASGSPSLESRHLCLQITPQNLSRGQPYSSSRYFPSSELSKSQSSLTSSRPWPVLTSRISAGRSKTPLPQSQNLVALSISGWLAFNGPMYDPLFRQPCERPVRSESPHQGLEACPLWASAQGA